MNKKLPIIAAVFVAFIVLVSWATASPPPYEIDGDTVFINTTDAYISATPHTLHSSRFVYFNVTAKQFSGNITAIWGFNTSQSSPRFAQLYSPHNHTWITNHKTQVNNVNSFENTSNPCDYGNEYNTQKYRVNHTTKTTTSNTTSETTYNYEVKTYCFDSYEQTGINYTIYWQTNNWEWRDWVNLNNYQQINKNFNGKDSWYYIPNIPINQGQTYTARVWMDVKINSNGKYDFAVFPSSYGSDITTAYNDGNLYLLDPWWNSSWFTKINLTIQSALIDAPLKNLSVMVELNSINFDFIDAEDNGEDIRFVINNTTELDYEIEYWNSTSEQAWVWVRVPTVSDATDTIIEMYYSNPDATDNQNPASTWANATGIWHLNESTGNAISSTMKHNGTTSGTITRRVDGAIDGAYDFQGADGRIRVADSTELENSGHTIQFCYKGTDDTNDWFMAKDDGGSLTDASWAIIPSSGKFRFYTGSNQIISDIYFNDDKWQCWSWVHYANNTSQIYNNGTFEKSATTGEIGASSYPLDMMLVGGENQFKGAIDEVRYWGHPMSAAFVKADFHSQANTLLTYGAIETPRLENNLTVTITPSTTVLSGTSITAECTQTGNTTLNLYRDGIGISNPYTATLATGIYNFSCTSSSTSFYTRGSNYSILTVGAGGAGCSNNLTYSFNMPFTVTDDITVFDLLTQRDNSYVRPDLQDTHVIGGNATIVEINASRYVVINTTGKVGDNVTLYWGNFLNNMSHTTNTGSGATSTNTMANITQYNESVVLTFKNEQNSNEMLMPSANMTVYLHCDGGIAQMSVNNGSSMSNWTTFTFATYTSWEKIHSKILYGANDFYSRHRVISASYTETDVWLPDAISTDVIQIENELFDTTGEFSTSNLTVKKYIGDALEIIDQQFFGLDKIIYFYGISGHEYQYYISNGDETRSMGNLVIDATNPSITLIIQRTNITDFESLGDIVRSFSYNNTTGIIRFYYRDPYDKTAEVNMSIYNYSDGNLLNFQQVLNTAETTFIYNVSDTHGKYRVVVGLNHEPDIGTLTWVYVAGGIIGTVMTTVATTVGYFWTRFAALGLFYVAILSFGQRYAFEGALFGGVIITMMSVMNWLPLHIYLIGFYWLGIVLWYIKRGAKDETD